ncbi:hypothetical protein HDU80_002672, partial [Chytriomyces hyalinus]
RKPHRGDDFNLTIPRRGVAMETPGLNFNTNICQNKQAASPTGERPASGSNSPRVEPTQAGAGEELGVGTQTTHQSHTPHSPVGSRTASEAGSSSRAPGEISSARQPRTAKTPPSDSGDHHDEGFDFEEQDDHEEETDNAETELASSDVEEEHLGAPLTGGPLKPRQSSGSLDLQVSGLFSDPEKTAFNIFYKFLDVGQSHVVDADAGLAVAFQSVVMDPVDRMGKLGDKLVKLAGEYGPAMFYLSQLFYCVYIEGLTTDAKLINQRNQKFSDDYTHLFNGKRPSDTMINGFSAAVLRFPTFLELECLKNAFDESKLAHNVPASMKLQYILQHASRYEFSS